MSRVEEYRAALRKLRRWEPYLLRASGLPGPRANLELAAAVAEEGDEQRLLGYAALDAQQAPFGGAEEFLAVCGVIGLGRLVAEGQRHYLAALRRHAADPRWRVREAVAIGLQRWGDADLPALLREMRAWAAGAPLEQRAAVAALCEPRLLRRRADAEAVLRLLDAITRRLLRATDRRGDDVRILRQALGYGWSVAVAACPEAGRARFERWCGVEDPDVRWIVRENLKKKRLERVDPAWVERLLRVVER